MLKRSDFISDNAFYTAREKYLNAFIPDACDPYPAPSASIGSGGGLPSAPPELDPFSQIMFQCLMHTQGCEWVTKNKIKITPHTSPTVVAAQGTTPERVGLRWCDCQAVSGSNNSVTGRAVCRTNAFADCEYNEARYTEGPSSSWLELTTKNGSDWTNPAVGAEWIVNAGTVPFSVTWDYTALDPVHLGGEEESSGVKGILWTHVDQLYNSNVPLTQANVRRFANAMSHGSAGRHISFKGHIWAAVNDWIECPMCDVGIEQVLVETSNPWWKRVTPEGLDYIELADATTAGHFDAMAAGTRLHIAASEPVALLSKMLAPTQSYVRALGLATNGAVVSKLTTTGLENVPAAQAYSVSGGPTFSRGEGVAFSALEQRLYVLGGLTSANQPKNVGWFLDVPTNTWRQFNMPTGETVGEVLATTYRHKDRAIYFLDRSGTTLRLRRWHAQRQLTSGVLVTLATFPSGWNAFGKYSVVAGPRGDIAVVAWQGTTTHKTRIGRFTLNEAHRISTAGLSSLTTPILAPPAMTPDRFAMTVASTEPTASSLSFATMLPDWRTYAPAIQPH